MSKQDELDKKDTRRGWATTLSVHAVLLIVFALFGLTYQDPPPEMGIPVNFGYEEDGAGETSAAPSEAASTPSASNPEVTEAAVTQDLVDAAAIPEKPKDKPKQTTTPTTTETQKPQEPEKPKVSNALSDRLKGGFTSTANPGTGSGQGNTAGSGDQGKPTGDLQGNGLGNGGTGNSGDYQLGSRKAQNKPEPDYDCPGSAIVVVKIWVDRSGTVKRAEGGVSGSTTTDSCFLTSAQAAAFKTKWQGDPSAVELQIGTITYRFDRR